VKNIDGLIKLQLMVKNTKCFLEIVS